MKWSNEAVIEFIELLKTEPTIWHPKFKDYKNRCTATDAWDRIAKSFSLSCPVDELKRKRNSLLTQYRDYLRKIKESIRNGCSEDDIYQPSWFAFNVMHKFLGDLYEYQLVIDNEENGESERPSSRQSNPQSINESYQTGSESSISGQKRKRTKRRSHENFPVIEEVPVREERIVDECDAYGQLLAHKLRKLNDDDRLVLMNNIDNLVFKSLINIKRPKSSSSSTCDLEDDEVVSTG